MLKNKKTNKPYVLQSFAQTKVGMNGQSVVGAEGYIHPHVRWSDTYPDPGGLPLLLLFSLKKKVDIPNIFSIILFEKYNKEVFKQNLPRYFIRILKIKNRAPRKEGRTIVLNAVLKMTTANPVDCRIYRPVLPPKMHVRSIKNV